MKKKPLISIIIPVTRINLLDTCIQSLLNNDISNCEIILHFNNVIKSKKLIKKINLKLKNKSNNLKIIFNSKLLKIQKNWEKALSYHEGQWVMFLCEDDLIYTNSIKNLELIIKKHKDCNCFFWDTNSYVYNHDKKILKISKNTYDQKLKLKKFNSKEILRKIFKNKSIHNFKKELPFFPGTLIRSKIIKKTNGNFFFNEEPMWSSAFQILNSEKAYIRVPFIVTIIGELTNSSSVRHSQLSLKSGKKTEAEKFIKNFSINFKYCHEVFSDLDSDIFIKFNRFFGFEIIMQSLVKFKKFRQFNFKINKKKILKEIYYEALGRNSEGFFFSYIYELMILRKKIDINLDLIYKELRVLFLDRIIKFLLRDPHERRYYTSFKNLDNLDISNVLKNIKK